MVLESEAAGEADTACQLAVYNMLPPGPPGQGLDQVDRYLGSAGVLLLLLCVRHQPHAGRHLAAMQSCLHCDGPIP